jgi:hypothetical protein
MAHFVRHCPDCYGYRRFERLHDQPGECPDSPDGNECPEWSCTACGAALLIGVIPVSFAPTLDVMATLRALRSRRVA